MTGRSLTIAVLAVGLGGCSLIFPMSEYDQGTGAGGADPGGAPAGGAPATGGEGGEGGVFVCDGGPNPPVSSVSSTFDGGLGGSLELLNCAVLEDGEVAIDATTEGEYCWFYTTGSHSLTCDSLTVRLLDAGTMEFGTQRFIYIREVDGPGDLQLLQEGGGFDFGPIVLDDPSFSLAADPWWRVSATADTISLATSSDGVEWRTRGSGPTPFSLDSVTIQIGAGKWGGEPGAVATARYDCFNVAAPCP